MRIARVELNGECFYAQIDGETLHRIDGLPYPTPKLDGRSYPLDQARLLAPVEPSKIVCVGLNYSEHIQEMGDDTFEEPVIFLKASTCIVGPAEPIRRPTGMSKQVDYEAELAVVIGKTASHVSPEEALDYVFGYTCGNDVTARDLQPVDKQWTRAKSFDTFAPLGPWVETELSPAQLQVQAYLNGSCTQDGNTVQMIHPVHKLISFISRVMTLRPGDVVLTGTPAGVGPVVAGDEIEIRIQGIGSLANPVVDA